MIIFGTGGHAREVLEVLLQTGITKPKFFDDITVDLPSKLLGEYDIITDFNSLQKYLDTNPDFVVAVGNPRNRDKLIKKGQKAGGRLNSIISPHALIGQHGICLGQGLNIMPFVQIITGAEIGDGTLLNEACSIHHDTTIGRCCEIGAGARVGDTNIGDFCFVGTNAVVPSVNLGNNVTVGAGAIVLENVPDNTVVAGVPAKIVKRK